MLETNKKQKYSEFGCPFKAQREKEQASKDNQLSQIIDQNEAVTLVLSHQEVRNTAKNWKTFGSGGKDVGRIVIPSEENIRDIRQIPFEVDPPEHKSYRDLLEAWFRRPVKEEYKTALKSIIDQTIQEVLEQPSIDIIKDFALTIQSRALTLLLNVPFEESETWISWGTHVFRSEETALDASKANVLYEYLDQKIDQANPEQDESLYAHLLRAQRNETALSKEEIKGVMILTFAGGRDTIINIITNSIAYLAEHKEAIDWLKEDNKRLPKAVEEFVRYFSPLTQMGRVTTEAGNICEHAVKANEKVSLVWASANRDETVFENPNEIILDRQKNVHVGFGFGTHNCLGATHARTLMKILLESLCEKIATIEILSAKENIEDLGSFKRKVGFDELNVKFNTRN